MFFDFFFFFNAEQIAVTLDDFLKSFYINHVICRELPNL